MPERRAHVGPTDYVVRESFVLEHNRFDRLALWVAEHLTRPRQVSSRAYRRPTWKADPRLALRRRADPRDYATARATLDRGHLAPVADFMDPQDRDETFVLSNAVPQDKVNNRGIWRRVETWIRKYVEKHDEAYVVSGAFFYEPAEDPELATYAESDGQIAYTTIGENRVAVPTHLFKVVLAKDPARPLDFRAIAFVVENRPYSKDTDLKSLVRSVDWIEARTGLDFFPHLAAEPKREAAIESVTPTRLWN